jgi:hypothetical protein
MLVTRETSSSHFLAHHSDAGIASGVPKPRHNISAL